MKKINCIIADDEPLAREIIERHLLKIEQLQLVATCSNGIEVFNVLKTKAVDLVFLDIQMPHLSGIELLRTLKNPPAVIITTAYREFAIEGYELNVIDYLLKPISFERFLKAVDRYQSLKSPTVINKAYVDAGEQGDNKAFIYIKCDKKMVRVMLKDLLYIEGLKDYVKVHTSAATLITYQTLTYFEEKLSADMYLRVHRSFIVSMDKVSAYSATQIEIGTFWLPIGGSYAKDVLKKLNL
jgi:DNA-binding LytR/AlgR family response regulator